MADRPLKLRKLKKILRRYGVRVDTSRGKGSHVLFWRTFPEGEFSYPVPNQSDVKVCYVKGCRRRFRLTPEEGVSDEDFYSDA